MPNIGQVIKELEKAGKRNRVKIIVGGAPVTDAFAAQIGEDGYAPDTSRAVAIAQVYSKEGSVVGCMRLNATSACLA